MDIKGSGGDINVEDWTPKIDVQEDDDLDMEVKLV